MLDWGQIIVGGMGAGLGTWFGAWAAFAHERGDRKERAHREEGEVLRRTMFVLLAQRTLLSNIWRQHLSAAVGIPLRHIAVHPFFVAGEELPVELDSLHFLLNTEDADLLNRLHVGNRRFKTILSTINLRNRIHLEGQSIVAERATGEGATEVEFRQLIGAHRWEQLKDFTNALYADVPRAIEEIDGNYRSVEAVARANYPTVKLFSVKELSAESETTT